MITKQEEEKEFVYLPKSMANKIKSAETDKTKLNIIDDYIRESKQEIKNNLESLESDVVQYKAMMLKAKEAFREAKEEQLNASYKLWEKFDKELAEVRTKVEKVKEEIMPIKKILEETKDLLNNINTYQVENLFKSIKEIGNEISYNSTNGKILKFIIDNYKEK